jgi:hypothetical protein
MSASATAFSAFAGAARGGKPTPLDRPLALSPAQAHQPFSSWAGSWPTLQRTRHGTTTKPASHDTRPTQHGPCHSRGRRSGLQPICRRLGGYAQETTQRDKEMTATLTFQDAATAAQFATAWGRHTCTGHDMGAVKGDGSRTVTVYHVNEERKSFIESFIARNTQQNKESK